MDIINAALVIREALHTKGFYGIDIKDGTLRIEKVYAEGNSAEDGYMVLTYPSSEGDVTEYGAMELYDTSMEDRAIKAFHYRLNSNTPETASPYFLSKETKDRLNEAYETKNQIIANKGQLVNEDIEFYGQRELSCSDYAIVSLDGLYFNVMGLLGITTYADKTCFKTALCYTTDSKDGVVYCMINMFTNAPCTLFSDIMKGDVDKDLELARNGILVYDTFKVDTED